MINMPLNSDFYALSNEELLVEIFQVVPKLVPTPQELTLRKSARQQRVKCHLQWMMDVGMFSEILLLISLLLW